MIDKNQHAKIERAIRIASARCKKILIDFDVKAFRDETNAGIEIETEVLVIAMHKARANFYEIPEGLKIESETWLKDRGYDTKYDGSFIK